MQRRYYIDYLKAFGCIAIVTLHVIANRLDHIGPTEKYYLILSALLILTRWAVPAFVMASGCNLLGREQEFELVKKHSIKILVLTFIWGFIYLFADSLINVLAGKPVDLNSLSLSGLFQNNAYHLWFCFMIVGLYLLIPILNPLIKDKKRCEYFIAICIFSAFLLPILAKTHLMDGVLGTIVDRLHFPDFGVYVLYFVLGYYLDQYLDLSPKAQLLLYLTSIISVLIMIAYSIYNAIYYQAHTTIATPEYLSAAIFSVGVFTFFKYHFGRGNMYPFFYSLAKYSLGIYVMHSYVIIRLSWKGFHSVMFHPLLAIPFVTTIAILICYIASWLIRRIPVIGKWVV